jgi:hypothetical protein
VSGGLFDEPPLHIRHAVHGHSRCGQRKRTRVTTFARVNGAGDTIVPCGFAPLEVIETEPGHDARFFEAPSSTIDASGTLYAVWNDRPAGPGGSNANATRIYLSYSRDGNQTWSAPQVISGRLAPDFMNDRFQPWVIVDTAGLHAMWYERVANPSGGADLIRTDKADLSLASATAAPQPINGGEVALSSQAFPIVQTNPNQDPVIANCYMGDYNQIASNGTTRFVSWGDNRNIVITSAGVTENQPDVFLQSYR